jgi:uridylate kinase
MSAGVKYQRILVKLSGEALMGGGDYGIDPVILKRIALEIQELLSLGVQVAVIFSVVRASRALGWIG